MLCFAIFILSLYCLTVNAFLPPWMPGAVLSSAPELLRQAQTDFDIRLSIGLSDDAVFVIDGIQLQLCSKTINKDETDIPLPGAHGPRPHLSNGVHQIDVLKDGAYINMEGLQTVALHDGVWEMIWRQNSPAGIIICGFSLDKDAVRNESILEKGQIYLTWPVWSTDSLVPHQDQKALAAMKYEKFETERDSELEKMNNTPNILKKALHFRNAAAATEQMDYTGLHNMNDIPSTEEVLDIGDGLQIVKSGTVWSKTGSFEDSFRANRQRLLGSATLCG